MSIGRHLSQYERELRRAWVILDMTYYPSTMRYRFRVSYDYRNRDNTQQIIWRAEFEIDEVNMTRYGESEVLELVDRFVMQFAKAIPENITGDYPHIRLWADINHHHNPTGRLFGNPDTPIEGWVFGRYRAGTNGRYDNLDPLTNVNIEGTSIDEGKRVPTVPKIETISDEEAEGLMAATKKKRVVKTSPPKIDPSKIKSPMCPVHHEKMTFDPVKYKWKCNAPGCKLTSRPVRDEDDKSVQIGKGETSLRIVATPDDFAVLLVSDDNLALNITNMLPNIKVFLDSLGAIDLARTAEDQGVLTAHDQTPRNIQFETRFAIIGITDLIGKYESNDF